MGLSVVRRPSLPFPSPWQGGRDALRVWPLVVAGWVVATLAVAPLWVLVDAATTVLDRMPVVGPVVEGDLWLIAAAGVSTLGRPMISAVVAGSLLTWLWGVLWRGSLVGWKLWASDRRLAVGELLGHGLVHFGRFFRLALASALAMALGLVVVWAPAVVVLLVTGEPPPPVRLWILLLIGGSGTMAVMVAVALASLRGAWLLGRADHRSAVVAWLRGLDGAIQQPSKSLLALIVWWAPVIAAAALPLVVGWLAPPWAGRVGLVVMLSLSMLVRSACRVALLASFAPTAGLSGTDR